MTCAMRCVRPGVADVVETQPLFCEQSVQGTHAREWTLHMNYVCGVYRDGSDMILTSEIWKRIQRFRHSGICLRLNIRKESRSELHKQAG